MKIIKLNNRVWKFEDVEIGEFSPSKFTINRLNNKVTVVYFNNLKSKTYDVADVEIYDIGSVVPFTTTNGDAFMLKLEELNCPCFQKDETTIIGGDGSWGSITGTLSDQTDLQNALNSKLDKVTATTGAIITFDKNKIFNTSSSPSSANITNDLTNAKLGVVQKIYHNNSVEPTYPAGWVNVSPVAYAVSELNIIYAEWCGGSRVEYWITQEN